ncbi:MAG: hypothetical protein GX537_07130 [Actinobacteria bacterium]|nr:hypothetical protein [Actinomycetota bacterium]
MSRRSRQPRRCASRRLLLGARLAGARRAAVRWRFQTSRTPRGGGLLRDAPRELAALLEPLRADAPVGRRELVFLRFFFAIALRCYRTPWMTTSRLSARPRNMAG